MDMWMEETSSCGGGHQRSGCWCARVRPPERVVWSGRLPDGVVHRAHRRLERRAQVALVDLAIDVIVLISSANGYYIVENPDHSWVWTISDSFQTVREKE